MRYLLCTLLLFSLLLPASAQQLLETKDGNPLFFPVMLDPSVTGSHTNRGLIKANTSDQSIGMEYYRVRGPINLVAPAFFNAGIKAKPTEGYATVFKNGQFSPGVTLSMSLTKVKIFDRIATRPDNHFIDWGSLYINFSNNKYMLYRADTTYKNQFINQTFNGIGLGVNYNALINSKYLVSIKIGYARKDNYNSLSDIEVKDVKTIFDSATNTTRQVVTGKTVKQGKYAEFDSYPLSISFTRLTDDGAAENVYDVGYSLYMNVAPTNGELPKTNAGGILFLTKVKDHVSSPILGLNFQFSDFFDVDRVNNGLFKRMSIGFTTNIPIL
ncbi:MAG: hypothetical protein JST82_01190 [Bacteroidetes bacterium]|nr:hypothetical protein [Bacteroidota bacterium]